ncbi:MAG: pseudouridine synthase [Chitinophagales bacterium]
MSKFKYYIAYKPFNCVTQFTPAFQSDKSTLKDFFNVEKDVYPIGRLDADSEGLLLLSNDKALNFKFLNPENEHARTYWAQVEGQIDQKAISALEKGPVIRINKKDYKCKASKARIIETPQVPERNPPVRFRKNIPTSWIEITLTEGKNRQVRKMCAAVGFPCLRLIRVSMENLKLPKMEPGKIWPLEHSNLYQKLGVEHGRL